MRKSLEERYWPKVDKLTDPAGCWLWTAYRDKHGYGQIHAGGDGSMLYAHRVGYEIACGRPIQQGMEIDHACHNASCVNPEHLQEVDRKRNLENRAGAQVNSQSGIRGVYWHKMRGKWRVEVVHHGVGHHGGLFSSIEEAEQAAIELRNALFTNNLMDPRTDADDCLEMILGGVA